MVSAEGGKWRHHKKGANSGAKGNKGIIGEGGAKKSAKGKRDQNTSFIEEVPGERKMESSRMQPKGKEVLGGWEFLSPCGRGFGGARGGKHPWAWKKETPGAIVGHGKYSKDTDEMGGDI